MKRPLGRSFQSVLDELAEEMQKFNEMDGTPTNSVEETVENQKKAKEKEGNYVC